MDAQKGKDLVMDKLYIPEHHKFLPEPDKSGNIEYKLRLDKKDGIKIDNMVSQMLWRLNEGRNQYGKYEAHYILGIKDDGNFSDITEIELNKSLGILKSVAKKANAKIITDKTYVFHGKKMIIHAIVRKDQRDCNIPETNIMIMGTNFVGKSSLMSRLTYGQKDDGNGFARKLVLRHIHEKTSGNTSSIKYDTIGFSGKNIINYSIGIQFDMESIYNSSDILVNLIDVPGDFKCIKTIIHSFSSTSPENMIICIPCCKMNETVLSVVTCDDVIAFINLNQEMYKFIALLCVVHKILPTFVLTKVDMIENKEIDLKTAIADKFNEFIRGNSYSSQHSDEEHEYQIDFKNSLFIKVSNVTDEGYDDLINELCTISFNNERKTINQSEKSESDILFVINDVFTIPDTGTIYHGTLLNGSLGVDDEVNVLSHGMMIKKKIKSIHRKTLDVDRLFTNESGSVIFNDKIEKVDKTGIIIGSFWENKIITKSRIIPTYGSLGSIKLKAQQYLLFVSNNIITVLLTIEQEINSMEYWITCMGNVSFVLNVENGILKDEQHNYFFIKFV
jgi:GTPase